MRHTKKEDDGGSYQTLWHNSFSIETVDIVASDLGLPLFLTSQVIVRLEDSLVMKSSGP